MRHLLRSALVVATVVALSAAGIGPSRAATAPHLGVYAGPDSKGVAGARIFDRTMHQRTTEILDFTPLTSWSQIEGESWLLGPHAAQSARLELSLPVVPSIPGASLAGCASGAENMHWSRLAHHLVADHLAGTIVRPGWEFNGNWYRWSAAASPSTFARCFRQVVRTMRRATGQHFRFDWNVAAGPNTFAAERAWPGRAYVDVVGVDVYDMSWAHYFPGHRPTAHEQQQVLADLFHGDHGVYFWSHFAAKVHRPLAIPEWGVTWLASGHGGGDDPAFVSAVFAFVRTHNVAYARYFESINATTDHTLTGRTRFPRSAAMYRRLVR